MDADLEIRVTRFGRRARQLVIIPDADISEAEAESEDDVDDPDYGTTLPTVSQDDESDLSTDDDDIPSANLFQTTEPTSSKSRNKNGHNFRWRSMNQPVVDTTWKDVLPDCPDEVGTPISYFGQFFTPDMMQLIVEETNRYAVQNGSRFRNKYAKSGDICWNSFTNGYSAHATLPNVLVIRVAIQCHC
ncbi:PiggyBac transposable element-derived protein 3 [Biomphalaria pfeifferi]|uniref:PiggyBac transposable element-derived protein 3 n=1 Tax=Biomphalaria pfeifferi TaxID=112525 RepID=A0AAD8FGF1_BIOPF|nr:PiggyBac transposable element-derived protein 3 [Biomphalaria pfeifferi]